MTRINPFLSNLKVFISDSKKKSAGKAPAPYQPPVSVNVLVFVILATHHVGGVSIDGSKEGGPEGPSTYNSCPIKGVI
jgi:hypothetical protein